GVQTCALPISPHAEASLALLAREEIAAFRTPESCADALAAYFSWRSPREVAKGSASWPRELPKRGRLDEAQSLGLFASLGITVVKHEVAGAPAYAHAIGYPVAVKALCGDILQRPEAGAVRLNVSDRTGFDREVGAMLRRVSAKSILVQKMESGLAEAIVGYRHDPLVGPVVMIGAGGTLAEIYRDFALALAPVSEEEAASLIGEVKGFAMLPGYRNL